MGEELEGRSGRKSIRLEGDEGGKVEGKNDEELERTWRLSEKRNRSVETVKKGEDKEVERSVNFGNASTSALPSLAHSPFTPEYWVVGKRSTFY